MSDEPIPIPCRMTPVPDWEAFKTAPIKWERRYGATATILGISVDVDHEWRQVRTPGCMCGYCTDTVGDLLISWDDDGPTWTIEEYNETTDGDYDENEEVEKIIRKAAWFKALSETTQAFEAAA